MKECDRCGLISHDSATICDCGWNLNEKVHRYKPEKVETYSESPSIAIGLVWLFSGIFTTVLLSALLSSTGYYVLAFGPIFYGTVVFFRALSSSIKTKFSSSKKYENIDENESSYTYNFPDTEFNSGSFSEKHDFVDKPQTTSEVEYGKILGLRGKVTFVDISREYKKLISQYHPDKVQHLGEELRTIAAQKTTQLNEAYDYFRKKYGN